MFPYALLCVCYSVDYRDISVLNLFLDFWVLFLRFQINASLLKITVLVAFS